MWRATTSTGITAVDTAYLRGPIAFRAVGAEQRLLIVSACPSGLNSCPVKPTAETPMVPDLLEVTMPATYGAAPATAPELTYVRRWTDWASGFYYEMNGVNIGGMWYDAEWDVLWYTYYSSYDGPDDPPFLGASKLNDDGTVTKYGPWKHPNAAQYYRTSAWWIYGAPASVKAVNANAEMCLGGAVGSTAQNGNYGPGLYWYKRPALNTSGSLSASEWGPLMAYSYLFGSAPDIFAQRSPNYTVLGTTNGIQQPTGGVGRWIASLDQMSGHVWIESASKWGIVTLGRMVKEGRYVTYNHENPTTIDGTTYYSNTASASGNTYRSFEIYTGQATTPGIEPAMLFFNPAQALEVEAGMSLPYNVISYSRKNWFDLWNIPIRLGTLGTYPNPGDYQVIYSPAGQPSTSTYDPVAQRVLWMTPATYGASRYPTIQVWDVN